MTYAIRDEAYLHDRSEFLNAVGMCLVSAKTGEIEVCHIRLSDALWGKQDAGMALKPGHQWTVPLLRSVHRQQHDEGERLFWVRRGWDPASVVYSPLAAACVLTQFHLTWNIDGARAWIMARVMESSSVRG